MQDRRKHPRRQTYPVHRVKAESTYDVHEIAKLGGYHRGTVRNWLKNGLKPLDGSRPTLVHGTELKRFWTERRGRRRRKCAIGEFYCFRCRQPRTAWGSTADATPHTDKVLKLAALCTSCETPMNRMIRRSDLAKYTKLMEIRALGPERLSDCVSPSENTDS